MRLWTGTWVPSASVIRVPAATLPPPPPQQGVIVMLSVIVRARPPIDPVIVKLQVPVWVPLCIVNVDPEY